MQQTQSPRSWGKDELVQLLALLSNTSSSSGAGSPPPKETVPEEMEFPLPADGVIPLNIQLMNETEALTIDVRWPAKYDAKAETGKLMFNTSICNKMPFNWSHFQGTPFIDHRLFTCRIKQRRQQNYADFNNVSWDFFRFLLAGSWQD